MKRKEWEALRSLSLEDKKKELEKEKKLFIEAYRANPDDIKGTQIHLDRMDALKRMIEFNPDPDYYKKKRAEERAEWGEKKRREIAGIVHIQNL